MLENFAIGFIFAELLNIFVGPTFALKKRRKLVMNVCYMKPSIDNPSP